MQAIQNIIDIIEASIQEDPAREITSGGFIKAGYDSQVDELRAIQSNSLAWLADYQQKLCEQTWIPSLKIKYTNVSGYFIDVLKSQVEKVPPTFILRQTLVTGNRYITQELKEFETKLLNAESLLAAREYELFQNIRREVNDSFQTIKHQWQVTSNIDFAATMAYIATENNYVRPQITTNEPLKIVAGRHPVVEKIERDFIANNLEFGEGESIHIITGPNMWGKSTFLRQNALIVLLAHIGSFVPAREARIPLTDRIFSRVGASDNLFSGQSTFMVEMQETAYILNNATSNSFIIIDEIGRWTSTFDGMSLAWGVLKYLHDTIQAPTLFATHYHELIDASYDLPWVKNFSVAVGENEENLVFLRKIIPGGIKKSFGIEVARIAGINPKVIEESKKMLQSLETGHKKNTVSQLQLGIGNPEKEIIYIEKSSPVEDELKKLDINTLTPMEALMKLDELKKRV
jgi:DNA mismatch repair protein MutS